MKLIKILPFNSVLDNDELDCGLWQSDTTLCEFNNEQKEAGICDNSGLYYGTSDSREPKFCARHFYQRVVDGNGIGNYGLSK